MKLAYASVAIALLAGAAYAQPADPMENVIAGPVASNELVAAIRARDAELFEHIFGHCDADALTPMVAAEFEFVHDKWGTTARTPEEFISGIRGMCARIASGEDVRASRVLDADSLRVFAVQQDGAIEIGTHRFYGLSDNAPPALRETGEFFMHWKLVDGQWKLARVYSYNHRPGNEN